MRILVIVSLGIVLASCGNGTPTPDLSSRITAGVTVLAEESTLMPTPQPSATVTLIQDCPETPRSRLILQERGRVIEDDDSLNLRAGPGLEFDILARLEPGEIFFVLGGPTCAETFAWYFVRYRGFDGWVAEGDFDKYYVEPYLAG